MSNRWPQADGNHRDAAEPWLRVPATARPLRTHDDVSEDLDTSSGPTAMAHHPGTRLLTCSRPYDVSRTWDTLRCPQDAPDMPNGMSMPFGTSPDVPNVGLAIPQAGRNYQDSAFHIPAITRASCTCYDVSGHPDTPFGPSTVVHHPGTHSNMCSTSPDVLGHCLNAVSHSRDRAACFLRQKTCPSHRTRLPDVMDVAGTWPSTPRPFQTTGSSPSPGPPPGTHFPHPTTPRVYPDLQICLWAPG